MRWQARSGFRLSTNKRLQAGGGGETGPGVDGLHHPLWPVPVQSDPFWTVQRVSHLSEAHGDGPERLGRVQGPSIPGRHHCIRQDCRRAYDPAARGAPPSPGSGPEREATEMPAHEKEGGILGPYHISERHCQGPKQNFLRAGVADTDLRDGVAAVGWRSVGLVTYYRKFVNGFANIAAPLHRLLEKGAEWNWSKACQSAFDALKYHRTSAPILAYPEFHHQFTVDDDVRGDGLGAVLSQREGKTERVVAYASRTLTKAELWYCATRKEMICFVWALREFRPYL
ncbi:conserved hypothetical protein [Trichinella spiralis]|uniref:hypothetical protein n=1 Tax=Trichinella spiralis TaxID=6334 RepID=UPI0001EFCA2A|nr:conserved hypothetical protein [Trichinella spiralis]